MSVARLEQGIFRNYDIRGEYGTELTSESVYTIARAYAVFSGAKKVVIGSDARVSSPELKAAAVKGLQDSGIDVEDVGMSSTDVLYFATWHGKYDGGIMITASHMPKQFNGMKFLHMDGDVLAPIGRGFGMEELQDIANSIDEHSTAEAAGTYTEIDVWDDFVKYVHSFVDVGNIKNLHVVMDAGNGMGGLVADRVFKGFEMNMDTMFFEPDGTFPNHDPNPFIPENRVDIEKKVVEVGADIGIAWDADCDRCYFIDENGQFVHGDFITALLAVYFLKKNPGAHIVYDLRSSWAVKHWIEKMGGVGYVSRVGHTFIKPLMREHNAIFGGETSGHYYFRENMFMDNGFIPALIVLEMLATEGKTMSEMIAGLGEYHLSGEINFKVTDTKEVIARIKDVYHDGSQDTMDGLSVSYDTWHFNVRPSANDPVLRLNIEATSKELLEEKLSEVKSHITA